MPVQAALQAYKKLAAPPATVAAVQVGQQRARFRRALVVAVLAAVSASAAAAGPPLVSRPPASLHAGDVWRPKIRAPKATAFVIAWRGARQSFRLTRRGRVRVARVVFPRAGRWRYGVRIARRTRLVGQVDVLPRRLHLREPFDVLRDRAGGYLVADRTGNAVYRLRGKELTRVARIPGARDLEPTASGRVLVASGAGVVALDPTSGRIETVARADNDILGVAAEPDGAIVVSELGNRLVRFAGARKEIVLSGLEGVHGVVWTEHGLVACESSTGRVLRLARGGGLEVIASGLDLPSFAARGADGSLFVSEFGGGRIVRISPGRPPAKVAEVPSPAGTSVSSDGSLLVASLGGRVARVDPATGRVTWLV